MYIVILSSGIVACAIIGLTIIVGKGFKHDAGATAKVFRELVRNGNGVWLTTVLSIIIGATFLSLAEKLDSGILALLSSIAGYTLGGLRIEKKQGDESSKPE